MRLINKALYIARDMTEKISKRKEALYLYQMTYRFRGRDAWEEISAFS